MQLAFNENAAELTKKIQCPICLMAINEKPVQIGNCRCNPKYTYCDPCLNDVFKGNNTAKCPFCRDEFLKTDIVEIDRSYVQFLIKMFWGVIIRSDEYVLTKNETSKQFKTLADKCHAFIKVNQEAINLYTSQLELIGRKNVSNTIITILETASAALYLIPAFIPFAIAGTLVVNGVDFYIGCMLIKNNKNMDAKFQEIEKRATELRADNDVRAFLIKYEKRAKSVDDLETPVVKSIQGLKNIFTIAVKVADVVSGAKVIAASAQAISTLHLSAFPAWVLWGGLALRVTISVGEYGYGIKRKQFLRDAIKSLDDEIKDIRFHLNTVEESMKMNSML